MLLNFIIRKWLITLVIEVLKGTAFGFVGKIPEHIIRIGRHVSALVSFLPANREHIFSSFEEGFEEMAIRSQKLIHVS